MLPARKHRISRLEEFSDAVFGFALTLLVITSSVPRSYEDLMALVRGIPAFACCFALLVWIWHEHDAFFERYPGNDAVTLILNGALLFTLLVYVYPLKFMFEAFMLQVFGIGPTAGAVKPMQLHELANASILYGLGFMLLTGLLGLLYLNAYRLRDRTNLTELEAFDARSLAGHQMVSASVGLFAMLFALLAPLSLSFLAPSSFALMGPGHAIYGARVNKRRAARFGKPVGVAEPA